MKSRGLVWAALFLGGFVLVSEIPYLGSRSALWPVLTALGLAVIALAAAQLLSNRE